jgi:hypothetical protein
VINTLTAPLSPTFFFARTTNRSNAASVTPGTRFCKMIKVPRR